MAAETVLEHFLELVAIDSPTGSEAQIRNRLQDVFRNLGAETETDAAGNLRCRIPGTREGQSRLFGAHMDTVEPGRGVRAMVEADGTIHADGTTVLGADDKDGIAVIWTAMENICSEHLPHPPLEFLFTVGEEDNLLGSSQLQAGWLQSCRGWIFDGPGNPGVIYANGVGKRGFRLTVHGRAAHSGICPEKGVNALVLAAEGIRRFRPGRYPGATVNYGTVRGGIADNIVPDRVVLTGEIRSSDGDILQHLWTEMEKTWTPVAAVEPLRGYPAYELPRDSRQVRRTAEILNSLGMSAAVVDFQAGCDANYLSRLGLEVCTLAMGRKDNHTVNEITEIRNLEQMAAVAQALMTAPEF